MHLAAALPEPSNLGSDKNRWDFTLALSSASATAASSTYCAGAAPASRALRGALSGRVHVRERRGHGESPFLPKMDRVTLPPIRKLL